MRCMFSTRSCVFCTSMSTLLSFFRDWASLSTYGATCDTASIPSNFFKSAIGDRARHRRRVYFSVRLWRGRDLVLAGAKPDGSLLDHPPAEKDSTFSMRIFWLSMILLDLASISWTIGSSRPTIPFEKDSLALRKHRPSRVSRGDESPTRTKTSLPPKSETQARTAEEPWRWKHHGDEQSGSKTGFGEWRHPLRPHLTFLHPSLLPFSAFLEANGPQDFCFLESRKANLVLL
jgi:hypothetical protein